MLDFSSGPYRFDGYTEVKGDEISLCIPCFFISAFEIFRALFNVSILKFDGSCSVDQEEYADATFIAGRLSQLIHDSKANSRL